MGYLVSFAAIRGLTDTAPLHAIDRSLPWRAHRVNGCDLVLVEWLQRPNRNNPPPHNQLDFPSRPDFGRRPAGVAFKDSFGVEAPAVDALVERLKLEKRLGTFPIVAVRVALMLHRLVDRPVLSVCSDDDEWDLACEVDNGEFDLIFRCDSDEIRVGKHSTEMVPLGAAADPLELHRIARQSAAAWCEPLDVLFGFDGDASSLPLREIDRVNYTPEMPSPNARHVQPKIQFGWPRPFWKFWS